MSILMQMPQEHFPSILNFVFGGTAGMMAISAVHPLNLVKIRMQLSGQLGEKATMSNVISNIVKKEGFTGIYKGLTASLLRQSTYTTMRLGVYTWLLQYMKTHEGTPPSFPTKVGLGVIAGVCGATVGTPAEICMVRMTMDGSLPPAERRHYTHVANAIGRIAKQEGVLKLWKGYIPTLYRSSVVNGTQLAIYSHLKQMILATHKYEDGLFVHFIASMVAGFSSACSSMPIDIVKTRIQFMKTVNGVPEYKGTIDAFGKIVGKEGVPALWKGFLPYYARTGTHTVLTFIIVEQMRHGYRKYYL